MARPKRPRSVCNLPENKEFGPLGLLSEESSYIQLTVDEYETIRLIDYEGLTQQECSEQMKIGRTTVQGIYGRARKKLAQALVKGEVIVIEGGHYKLCKGLGPACTHSCRKRRRHCNKELVEESEEEI